MFQGNGKVTLHDVFFDILTSLPDGVVQVVRAALRNKETTWLVTWEDAYLWCWGKLCQIFFIQVNGGLLIRITWVWTSGARPPPPIGFPVIIMVCINLMDQDMKFVQTFSRSPI